MYEIATNTSLFLSIINVGICILGDYLVDINHESLIARAIFDNGTHAAIGLLSGLILIFESNSRLIQTEQCFLICVSVVVSSFIDIDHFIVARSLKLSVISAKISLFLIRYGVFFTGFHISASGQHKSATIFAFYHHSHIDNAADDSRIPLVSFVSLEFMVVCNCMCIFFASYTWCNTARICILAIWCDKIASISIVCGLHCCYTICISKMALFYSNKSITLSFNGRHIDDLDRQQTHIHKSSIPTYWFE